MFFLRVWIVDFNVCVGIVYGNIVLYFYLIILLSYCKVFKSIILGEMKKEGYLYEWFIVFRKGIWLFKIKCRNLIIVKKISNYLIVMWFM